MNAWEVRYFHSWMSFQVTIKSKSNLKINTRQPSSSLGVPSPIGKCLSALKMLEPPFSGYPFHDITKIVKDYLDDLATHSKNMVDHPAHLRAIFERCRKYKIRLNPLKCNFCVVAGRLLGFIVSKHRIMVDPFKVEAILQLSPPHIVH